MRFVTFHESGQVRAGVLSGEDRVIDLAHKSCAAALGGTAPDLLKMLEAGLAAVADRLDKAGFLEEAELSFSSVHLVAPLERPPLVYGAAYNYRCALAERNTAAPEAPVTFEMAPDTVVGPGASVILPRGVGGVTYEAELAVVIGSPADQVSVEDAMTKVAGYTLFNDISASEVIRADGNFVRGKNFPTFAPMGPYIATPDEFDAGKGQRVTLDVDGVRRQDGITSDLVFGVAALISHLSHIRPLPSGTVIATGTPAGVAPVQTPPTWLQPGTTMTVEIEGLGRLTNPVVAETSHAR